MIIAMVIGTALAVGLGFLWKAVVNDSSKYSFTPGTFFAACLVTVFIVSPLVSYIGYNQAKSNLVKYWQNLNGWEVSADISTTTCARDGNCFHEYDCDPYTVKTTRTRKDGSTYTEEETKYHKCPYTDEEWRISVITTVGEVVLAPHNLPTNPEQHRFRSWDHLDSSIPSGIPDEWQAAKERTENNKNGPATIRNEYDNYILASQVTSLKQSVDSIKLYLKESLLPGFAYTLRNYYQLDRVYFVGSHPAGDWSTSINRFNAAFGMSRQGDLHLVLVDASKITDPDDYGRALLSYWQSYKFGRNAFSKNGVVVIVGTSDGQKIAWARAYTGMPKGNEALLDRIRYALVGIPLTPQSLLGNPTATKAQGYKATLTDSALEKLLMGPDGFVRVCMTCKGKGEVGFSYLITELRPTTGQTVIIGGMIVVFSVPVWWLFMYFGTPTGRSNYRRWS